MKTQLNEILGHIQKQASPSDISIEDLVQGILDWEKSESVELSLRMGNLLVTAKASNDQVFFKVTECTNVAGVSIVQSTSKFWQFELPRQ